jgi:hypothetical protein
METISIYGFYILNRLQIAFKSRVQERYRQEKLVPKELTSAQRLTHGISTDRDEAYRLEEYRLLSDETLVVRNALFKHPRVQAMLQLWWDNALAGHDHNNDGKLEKHEFAAFYVKIASMFRFDEERTASDDTRVGEAFEKDWAKGCRGHFHMIKAAFMDCIFQLADSWCDAQDPKTYETYLMTLGFEVFPPAKPSQAILIRQQAQREKRQNTKDKLAKTKALKNARRLRVSKAAARPCTGVSGWQRMQQQSNRQTRRKQRLQELQQQGQTLARARAYADQQAAAGRSEDVTGTLVTANAAERVPAHPTMQARTDSAMVSASPRTYSQMVAVLERRPLTCDGGKFVSPAEQQWEQEQQQRRRRHYDRLLPERMATAGKATRAMKTQTASLVLHAPRSNSNTSKHNHRPHSGRPQLPTSTSVTASGIAHDQSEICIALDIDRQYRDMELLEPAMEQGYNVPSTTTASGQAERQKYYGGTTTGEVAMERAAEGTSGVLVNNQVNNQVNNRPASAIRKGLVLSNEHHGFARTLWQSAQHTGKTPAPPRGLAATFPAATSAATAAATVEAKNMSSTGTATPSNCNTDAAADALNTVDPKLIEAAVTAADSPGPLLPALHVYLALDDVKGGMANATLRMPTPSPAVVSKIAAAAVPAPSSPLTPSVLAGTEEALLAVSPAEAAAMASIRATVASATVVPDPATATPRRPGRDHRVKVALRGCSVAPESERPAHFAIGPFPQTREGTHPSSPISFLQPAALPAYSFQQKHYEHQQKQQEKPIAIWASVSATKTAPRGNGKTTLASVQPMLATMHPSKALFTPNASSNAGLVDDAVDDDAGAVARVVGAESAAASSARARQSFYAHPPQQPPPASSTSRSTPRRFSKPSARKMAVPVGVYMRPGSKYSASRYSGGFAAFAPTSGYARGQSTPKAPLSVAPARRPPPGPLLPQLQLTAVGAAAQIPPVYRFR